MRTVRGGWGSAVYSLGGQARDLEAPVRPSRLFRVLQCQLWDALLTTRSSLPRPSTDSAPASPVTVSGRLSFLGAAQEVGIHAHNDRAGTREIPNVGLLPALRFSKDGRLIGDEAGVDELTQFAARGESAELLSARTGAGNRCEHLPMFCCQFHTLDSRQRTPYEN